MSTSHRTAELGAGQWEVVPVRLGTMLVDTSQLLRGRRLGEKVQIPCVAWVVRNGDEVIVVDTGPSDAEWSDTHHNPMVRPADEALPAAFAGVGVDITTVEVVVNTHLHWDHCYGNSQFGAARFYVQAAELDYAEDPLPCDRPIYEAGEAAPFAGDPGRFVRVDGRDELRPGIQLVPTAGHTPGHQGVLVQGRHRRIFIAGDAVGLYENMDGDGSPGSLYTDLPAWYASLDIIRSSADVVLPGHDPRVFAQGVYS